MPRLLTAGCLIAVGGMAIAFFCLRPPASEGKTFRIGINANPPYQILKSDGTVSGVYVDLLNEAAERLGIRLKWVIQTEPDDALRRRKVDLWPVLAKLPEREKFMHFSPPWLEEGYDLVFADAVGADLLRTRGWPLSTFGLRINRYIARTYAGNAKLIVTPTRHTAIEALCNGAAKAVLMESRFAQAMLLFPPAECKSRVLQEIRIPAANAQFSVASTHAASAVADAISEQIMSIAEDGALEQIYTRYATFGIEEVQNVLHLRQPRKQARLLSYLCIAIAACLTVSLVQTMRIRRRGAELADSNRKLAAARAKLQSVFDAATHVSIVATGGDGRIEIFNSGAQRMLQYTEREMLGVNSLVLHDRQECESCAAELSRETGRPISSEEVFAEAARLGKVEGREWTYVRRDGSKVEVMLSVTPIRTESGDADGCLGIAVDISQLKALERELRLANEELAEQTRRASEATAAKSEFLAKMSHEIRTPMNSILGMAELLAESELSPEQRRYVEIFRGAGSRLLTLINDILDLSKIESGRFELEQADFDLEELLDQTVELIAVKAREKALGLRLRVARDVPEGVVGDSARLRQVLINLLGNAIKFTDSGEVVLQVTRETSDIGCRLTFSVSDTGIGIPAAKLSHVFDDFAQVDSSTTRKYGGTGLGLSISRQIVASMGGALSVSSVVGVGSSFSFKVEFPLSQRPASAMETREPVESDASARDCGRGAEPLRLLVAEDSADNRFLIGEYLKSMPFSLQFAETGAEAVEMASNSRVHLILMDVRMPIMDGLTAAAAIRRREAELGLPRTPIVALSANAAAEDASKSLAAGCDGHIGKPVSKRRLLAAIEQYAAPAAESAAPTWDFAGDSDDGLREAMAAILPGYIRDRHEDLRMLERSLPAGEFEGIARIGHILKGNGASYGFPEISRIGAALETAGDRGDREAIALRLTELRELMSGLPLEECSAAPL